MKGFTVSAREWQVNNPRVRGVSLCLGPASGEVVVVGLIHAAQRAGPRTAGIPPHQSDLPAPGHMRSAVHSVIRACPVRFSGAPAPVLDSVCCLFIHFLNNM